jgi:hypothetical protein
MGRPGLPPGIYFRLLLIGYFEGIDSERVIAMRPEPRLTPPKALFEQPYFFGGSITTANYDVSRDGQRFLMVKQLANTASFNVVLNWQEELKQRVTAR